MTTLSIINIDDETRRFDLDDETIITLTRSEHSWVGIDAVETALKKVAAQQSWIISEGLFEQFRKKEIVIPTTSNDPLTNKIISLLTGPCYLVEEYDPEDDDEPIEEVYQLPDTFPEILIEADDVYGKLIGLDVTANNDLVLIGGFGEDGSLYFSPTTKGKDPKFGWIHEITEERLVLTKVL